MSLRSMGVQTLAHPDSCANGARQTVQSAIMQPVVAGLTDDDIEALAHYFESAQEKSGAEQINE